MSDRAEGGSSGQPSRETRASILSGMRLSKDDNLRKESQARFFDKYWARLFVFFKRKVSSHDAEDLASALVDKLLKTMETFQYDPSKRFRSYLQSVAHNALKEFWKTRAKQRTVDGLDIQQLPARKELRERLEEQFDLQLLEEAEERVRGQVSARDWEIYIERTQRATRPEELAKRFAISRHAVDVAYSRVINRIQSEVRKLEKHGFQE